MDFSFPAAAYDVAPHSTEEPAENLLCTPRNIRAELEYPSSSHVDYEGYTGTQIYEAMGLAELPDGAVLSDNDFNQIGKNLVDAEIVIGNEIGVVGAAEQQHLVETETFWAKQQYQYALTESIFPQSVPIPIGGPYPASWQVTSSIMDGLSAACSAWHGEKTNYDALNTMRENVARGAVHELRNLYSDREPQLDLTP